MACEPNHRTYICLLCGDGGLGKQVQAGGYIVIVVVHHEALRIQTRGLKKEFPAIISFLLQYAGGFFILLFSTVERKSVGSN